MANGLTFLPAFGGQEANTAVLPENNQVMNTYLALNEKRYKDKVFDYQKNENDIKRRLDALDFNVSEVWQPDVEPIREEMIKYRDFVFENPDAVSPDSPLYSQQKQMADDINFKINLSKYDKANDTEYRKLMTTKPELATPENMKRLTSHKETKIGERNFQGFKIPLEDNPVADAKVLEGLLVKDNPQITMTPAGYGFVRETTTVPVKTENIEKGIKAMWQSSPQKQMAAQELFDQIPQQERDRLGYKTAYDVFKDSRLSLINTSPEVKSALKGINYAPQRAGKEVTDKDVSDRKALIAAIQNKDQQALDILRGLQYGGKPVKSVQYVAEPTEGAPTKIQIKLQDDTDVELEVSDKTGGGFFAINQFLNDLDGQQKIAVEDFKDAPKATQNAKSSTAEIKEVSGKKYQKVNGEWFEIE